MIKFDGSISAYSIQADVWSKSKSIFALIHYEKKKILYRVDGTSCSPKWKNSGS